MGMGMRPKFNTPLGLGMRMEMNFFDRNGYGIVKLVPAPPRCHPYIALVKHLHCKYYPKERRKKKVKSLPWTLIAIIMVGCT